MKNLLLVLTLTTIGLGCAHTPPIQPDPPPGNGLCGLTENSYDDLSDSLIDALADDISWQKRLNLVVVSKGHNLVLCAMKNVYLDLRDAPTERSRAQDWLEKNS